MLCQTECFVGAERTHFQRLDRQFQIINRAGGRGKVPDVIDRAMKKNEFRDVLMDEPEPGIAGQMGQVVSRAGHQVVYGNDLVVPVQEQVHQM